MITCASLLVGLHLYTHHLGQHKYVLENENPGIYLTCDEYTVGALRNSVERPLVYGLRTWPLGGSAFSISAGLGYGTYTDVNCLPVRMWVPMALISYKAGPVRISLLPPQRKGNATGIHFSLETKF